MIKEADNQLMVQLAEKSPEKLVPFQEGEVVEARVISVSKHKVLVDVAGVALGMVPEREFSYDVDDLNPGDKVVGYVLLSENRDGYVILSLKRADKERVWTTLNEKLASGEAIKVKVTSANRGGLLVEFGGVEGFIPVSQMSNQPHGKPENSTDQSKLVTKLREMIGESIQVKILTIDRPANKLIFSQKSAGDENLEKITSKVEVGTKLNGTISGIVDFGMFIKVNLPDQPDGIEGLVHISEVSWDRVEDLNSLYKVGQEVEVLVISNQNGRLSFSLKRLTPDPWVEAKKKFVVGETVVGEVTRVTPYGAFVKLPGNLDGLVHNSQLGDNITEAKEVVETHKSYPFRIISVEPEARKISLSFILDPKKVKAKETPKKETKTAPTSESWDSDQSVGKETKVEKPAGQSPLGGAKKVEPAEAPKVAKKASKATSKTTKKAAK